MRQAQKLQSEPQPDYDYGSGAIAINGANSLIWKTSSGRASSKRAHATWRGWKLVKWNTAGTAGTIGTLGHIRFPKRLVGKRIRINIEVIEDDKPVTKQSTTTKQILRKIKEKNKKEKVDPDWPILKK